MVASISSRAVFMVLLYQELIYPYIALVNTQLQKTQDI